MRLRRLLSGAVVLLAATLSACSDEGGPAPADTSAPSRISSLVTGGVTSGSLLLSWIAPGDDGTNGAAHQYDIRYSSSVLTEESFAAAAEVSGEPAPAAAGSSQTMRVSGLFAATPYFFAMIAVDEAGNRSELSNVAGATTAPSSDAVPPAAVADLAAGDATASAIALAWTAPGDDASIGTATAYDVRYSTSAITEESFAEATPAAGAPVPRPAGSPQAMTVEGLSAGTEYFFAIEVLDEARNRSDLSNVAAATTSPASRPGR